MQELKHTPDMPLELWVRILSFLSPQDLVMFARSSKINQIIALDRSLWKKMCRRWFPLFVENLLSLDNVDWRAEFINQYRQISRPPFAKDGFYWLFLEADEKVFSTTIPQHLNAESDIRSLWHFIYLAQGIGRRYVLARLFPEISKQHGALIASIICLCNDIAIALLQNSNEKELDDALRYAVFSGNALLVNFCLQRGDLIKHIASINQNKLLYDAASRGYVAVVSELLKVNIDKNIKGPDSTTPLAIACNNNHYAIIKLLIQSGVNDVGKAFIQSATDGKYKIFTIILDSNAITNENKASALLSLLANWSYSSLKDRKKILTLLLNVGVDVNCTDKYGRTPLHYAAKISHSLIQRLIALGAVVNVQDKNGITPLHLAAQHAGAVEIELLLVNGANINAQNRNGRCALHYAVMGKNVAALRYLLSKGADPMIKDAKNDTPLKLAQSLQLPVDIKTTFVSLLNQYSVTPQSNHSVMFFGKRHATEIVQSDDVRSEGLIARDKRTCRQEVLHDDPPARDHRTLRMS